MLVTMKELLDHASRENYAVPAPNIASEMDARPIIAAAEALRSPLILAVGYTANPDLTFLALICDAWLRRRVCPSLSISTMVRSFPKSCTPFSPASPL